MIAQNATLVSKTLIPSASLIFRVEHIVEFVELVMMASVRTRNLLIDALSS